jgi:hypothetical protein
MAATVLANYFCPPPLGYRVTVVTVITTVTYDWVTVVITGHSYLIWAQSSVIITSNHQ